MPQAARDNGGENLKGTGLQLPPQILPQRRRRAWAKVARRAGGGCSALRCVGLNPLRRFAPAPPKGAHFEMLRQDRFGVGFGDFAVGIAVGVPTDREGNAV